MIKLKDIIEIEKSESKSFHKLLTGLTCAKNSDCGPDDYKHVIELTANYARSGEGIYYAYNESIQDGVLYIGLK